MQMCSNKINKKKMHGGVEETERQMWVMPADRREEGTTE